MRPLRLKAPIIPPIPPNSNRDSLGPFPSQFKRQATTEILRLSAAGTAPNYVAAAGSASSPRPYFLQIQATIGKHHQGLSHGQIHEPMKRIAYTATNRAASTRISDRVAAPGAANSMSTTGSSSVR